MIKRKNSISSASESNKMDVDLKADIMNKGASFIQCTFDSNSMDVEMNEDIKIKCPSSILNA